MNGNGMPTILAYTLFFRDGASTSAVNLNSNSMFEFLRSLHGALSQSLIL
ncbi:hypothetical protein L798_03399 [Zootermopsis nevadensis]|uniref:Uncharacterized protein n=1 Tax=Zootermopsis nevadensis TaxID=136037 RepID=A0A067RMF3_ZOONE|nr:hypothetical protein L798_03399 [Zootermopsis nevadensis]